MINTNNKVAFIFGIAGQDGSYLSRFLLEKNYTVYGMVRRSSSDNNTDRIDDLISKKLINVYYGDITDSISILHLIRKTNPDEIYNLAAQSHVKISFETPEYTANVDALGALRVLEAIRILGLENKTRYLQASTSELFGNTTERPQSENTPFSPCSPYSVAKLYAYWITINYRNAYNLHATNGIFFNHESPLRCKEFVTHKITQAVANISLGSKNVLFLGNLNSSRDWGHASDYVRAMWEMLQQDTPDDYVIGTGITYSVRHFVEQAFCCVGIDVAWQGHGLNEVGINKKTNQILVRIDSDLFRPTEVDYLLADSKKARDKLKWSPKITLKDLIQEMIIYDIENLRKHKN